MTDRPPHGTQAALQHAEAALKQQEFDTCIRLCDEVLARDAINIPAHLFRGVAAGQTGQFERAIIDLGYVIERRPEQEQARFFLGQALRQNREFEAALGHFRPLLDSQAFRARALFEMALTLNRQGERDKAIEYYQALLSEQPRHADAAANLADLLERSNRLEEAENWADRALLLVSGNVSAKLTRARLHRRKGAYRAAMHLLEELLTRQLPHRTRTIACNQLAQCHERLGEFEDAFRLYAEANAVQKAHNPEAGVDDYGSYGIELVQFLRQWLRDHPADSWSETPPDEREAPVFMLGFPRSGTTLLDQALAAHPRIEVLEEQELLLEVRRKWIVGDDFHRLQDMRSEEITQARQLYRNAQAAARSNPDAGVVVDKLPLNSVYVQLIHRLFPQARIIFSLRDPRDVCLSCYFQTFELMGAMPYFLELESTAAYYDLVMGLLDEARDALPLQLFEMRYEALVEDYASQMQDLVRFLGLDWDDAVLDHRSGQAGRDISTPSYQQVSQPLYRHAIGRWRNYTEQLAPVAGILQPWVAKFGYDSASISPPD